MSFTPEYVASEELGMLGLDVGVITSVWLTFCLNERGIGLWNLPEVAFFLRQEIESDKHLGKNLVLFTNDVHALDISDVLD